MKVPVLAAFTILFLSNSSVAQSDTSIIYYAKDGHETTKDSGFSIIKFYKNKNASWHGSEYYLKSNILKSDGEYADNSITTLLGTFKNYTEAGKLDFIASYDNGKPVERTYFYKNGNKRSWVIFNDKKIKQQKGWDEDGKEIKNFIVMREATFKGGLDGWRRYLEKNLDVNVALDAGAPAGEYTAVVTFKISPEGYVNNVRIKSVPANCKPCGSEAVRTVAGSPPWQPAIMQNQPVEYLAVQGITFLVQEEKKRN